MTNRRFVFVIVTTAALLTIAAPPAVAGNPTHGWFTQKVLRPLRQRLFRAKQVGDVWIGTTLTGHAAHTAGRGRLWNRFLPSPGHLRGRYLMNPTTLERISPVFEGLRVFAGQPVATPFDADAPRRFIDKKSGWVSAIVPSGSQIEVEAGALILSHST